MRGFALALIATAALFSVHAGAQQPATSAAPPATAAPAATGGVLAPGSSEPTPAGSAEAEKKPAPPAVTGGYSWTDKPRKKKAGGEKRWRAKKIDPNAPIATYPAFRMNADGTSRVWVQVNRKLTVNTSGGSGVYTYVLTGAQIPTWNNTNPLVTEYFDTPLARARLKNDKNGAQLVLEMRESVQPKHRVVDGPNGSLILVIDLPKAARSYSTRNEDISQIGRRSGRTSPSRRASATPRASRTIPRRGPNP